MTYQLIKRQAIEIVARHKRYWEDAIAEIDDLPAPTHATQLQQALAMPEIAALMKQIADLQAACWRMQEERDRAIGWRDADRDRADKAEAKLAKVMDKTLDAANEYMTVQYGISALGYPIDRSRILEKIKGEQL